MKLSEVKYQERVVISKILGYGSFRRRISEMGFVRGKEIRVIKSAPFKGPMEFKILDYNVSLRKSEADLIEVVPVDEYYMPNNGRAKCCEEGRHGRRGRRRRCNCVIDRDVELTDHSARTHTINIALVGNPNSGKTTLFNHISNSNERVGNYSGVTVDIKKAQLRIQGYTLNFYDLPGTYSLTAYSNEEIFVRKFIYEETPDIVINVLDAANLERNLFLTTQLIDMDLRVIGALNMYDELERKGIQFDYQKLSELLGMPFIPTISTKGVGIEELAESVIAVFEGRHPVTRHVHIDYGKELERSITLIRERVEEFKPVTDKISSRFIAIKLLGKDPHMKELLSDYTNFEEIRRITDREISRIEKLFSERSETVITDAKYGFIAGAMAETFQNPSANNRTRSERIDSVVTHKYLGFPLFILILFVTFYATFHLGAYPMDWIDAGVVWIGDLITGIMGEGMLKDLLVNGIISGAGSVLVFLPNILILFLFITLMEETGYMARASFMMDNIMHKFGLHGRSFIPLIMGFGCNVPAILATRTMRNRGHRILTMLIIPFMSCSARLPVYILIISAFFQKYEALILIGLYMVGILFAFLTARIMNLLVFKTKEIPFVMELPPYRMPTLHNIVLQVWDKGKHYLYKIGTVILLGVIIIWALEYFPRETELTTHFEAEKELVITDMSLDNIQRSSLIAEIDLAQESDRLVNSYLGKIGRKIEPVVRPLGFDWKMSIALVAGLPAKEIVVSTMGVIYQSSGESTVNLQNKLQNERFTYGPRIGQEVFTMPSALAFLVFILLYFPCVAVIATIKNEAASWRWALFVVFYTTGLAWLAAFVTYNLGNFLIAL